MEDFIFKKTTNEQGLVEILELSGMLVLDNSEKIKNELLNVIQCLNNKIRIEIKDVQEIDITFIQIILAFINYLDDNHILYKFGWSLTAELQTLLENVGFSNELFLN